MSRARVAVLKVISKELSVTAAAAQYGYSRQHLHRLIARYKAAAWTWSSRSPGGPEATRRRSGQPGRPSRAMTQAQAGHVLKAASGKATRFVKVVKASNGRYGATHAATAANELACGTKPHPKATITDVSTELKEATCRSCRSQLG